LCSVVDHSKYSQQTKRDVIATQSKKVISHDKKLASDIENGKTNDLGNSLLNAFSSLYETEFVVFNVSRGSGTHQTSVCKAPNSKPKARAFLI
jgi:hypothetical protein